MRLVIERSEGMRGAVRIPPSKSHTMRAAIFAMLARGESRIQRPLSSPDSDACLRACEMFGATVARDAGEWRIMGTDGSPRTPPEPIDVGNSGIALRFLCAIAAGCSGQTTITGDESVRKNRPMEPTVQMINDLGGMARCALGNGRAPVIVSGPLRGGETHIDGSDSQHVSAALIASLLAKEQVDIRVRNPGELPWVEMTLTWLRRFGLAYSREGYSRYTLPGKQRIEAFTIRIPGDVSSAAFPLAAGLLTRGARITLEGMEADETQGDSALFDILKGMGAAIREGSGETTVESSELTGREIDVGACIDAVPILAVIGCAAHGTTTLTNAAVARKKESDRLAAMAAELGKMGGAIDAGPATLRIRKSRLRGAAVHAHGDHRVALALCVAGMLADGTTVIDGAECIAKTFADFPERMRTLGAHIRREG
jgi:3-phosphoshikimate 1-carboxyvinyltransferase